MTSNQSKIIITLLDSSSDNDQDEELGQEIEELEEVMEQRTPQNPFSNSTMIENRQISIEPSQSSLPSIPTSSMEFTTPPALNTRGRKKNSVTSTPLSSSSSTESLSLPPPLNSDSSLSEDITPTNKRKKSTPSPKHKIQKLRLDMTTNESQSCSLNVSEKEEKEEKKETTASEEPQAIQEVQGKSNGHPTTKVIKESTEKKEEDDLDCLLPEVDAPLPWYYCVGPYSYSSFLSRCDLSLPRSQNSSTQQVSTSKLNTSSSSSNDWKKIILGPNDDKESSSISDLEEDELEKKPLNELNRKSFKEKLKNQFSDHPKINPGTSSLSALLNSTPSSPTLTTDTQVHPLDNTPIDSTNVDIFSLFSQPVPSSLPTLPSVNINPSQTQSFSTPYSSSLSLPSSQSLPTNSKFSIPSSPLSSPLHSPSCSDTFLPPDSEPSSSLTNLNHSTLSPTTPPTSTLTTITVQSSSSTSLLPTPHCSSSSSASSPTQSLNDAHSSLSASTEYLPTTVSFMLHSSSLQTPSELMGEFELQPDEPFDIGLGKCLEKFPLDSSSLVLVYKNTKISKYCTPRIMGFQVYVMLDVFESETDFIHFQSTFVSSSATKRKPEQEETGPMLHLTLSDPSKNILKLKIHPTKPISEVIQAFQKKFNLANSIQLFGPDGDKLDPTLSCEELGLEDEDLVYVKKQNP